MKKGAIIEQEYDEYDTKYSVDDYFHDRKLTNNIYIRSLVRKLGISEASNTLDVGCGQGYFSYLFKKYGKGQVIGIDLSREGIRYAIKHYEEPGLHFEVCDAYKIPVSLKFDYILCRGLSLYNTDDILQIRTITEKLISHLKLNGIFILLYHSNLNKKKRSNSKSWRFHNLDEMSLYLKDYHNKSVYFICKLDCLFIGKFAFNNIITQLNSFISKILGWGGEIVCLIKQ